MHRIGDRTVEQDLPEQTPENRQILLRFFTRLRGHLQKLIAASGGGEKVFAQALQMLDKALESPDPITGLMLAGKQILSFLEQGYTAEGVQLEHEAEALEASQNLLPKHEEST